MPTLTFKGRLLPSCLTVNWNPGFVLNWTIPERGIGNASFRPRIEKSTIFVECEVDKFEENDFDDLYIRVDDIVRTLVDLLGFQQSTALSFHIESYINNSGEAVGIVPYGALGQGVTESIAGQKEFSETLQLVLKSPDIWRSLHALMSAFKSPHISLVHAGRVVEGVRIMISPNDDNRPRTWDRMREALNLDRAYVDFVTQHSIGPRHGETQRVEGVVTSEVGRRAWEIFDRFLLYSRRGGVPLKEPEFPLLVG